MARFDDGYETTIHFPGSTGPAVSLRSTIGAFERTLAELDPAVLRPIPTGFPNLDANTGGGLHAEDLVLVVGKQNVGKTLFVCQLGRNIARWAARLRNRVVCVLICYEHSPLLLLQRLLCMESWLAGGSEGGVSLAQIREALAGLAGERLAGGCVLTAVEASQDRPSWLERDGKIPRYALSVPWRSGVHLTGGDRQDGRRASGPGVPPGRDRRLCPAGAASTAACQSGVGAAYRLCNPLPQGACPATGRGSRSGG